MPGAESRAAFLWGRLAEGQKEGMATASSLCQWCQVDAWLLMPKVVGGPSSLGNLELVRKADPLAFP